ncbi:MAG: hybrid sensor histidine kinase/response regulator [Rubrivivax sp.]|nr:MAG: hybrid sensor histidine kinase/response regulator [Rubrivivax sp.]
MSSGFPSTQKVVDAFTHESHSMPSSEQEAMIRPKRMAQADAQALAYAKDEFLAVVTHELRSPLNAIRGWAHVLRQGGNLSPLQIKALDAIDRNTDVQARLVDDLLDSQRILSGDLRLVTGSVSLATLVNEAVETLLPSAMARKIQIELQHDPMLDTMTVDSARVNQSLVRLLSNAIKFSPEGGTVSIHTAHRAPWVEIAVVDEGHGLTAEQLPHVFDRFQQPGQAHTRQKSGLGLGLSLAHQLIKLHGGQIKADSPGPGLGSTFTVQLPDHLADDLPVSTGAAGASPLSGKRLVIVEDDDDAREILELVLREAQVDLRSFSRSADAFEYLAQAAPHEQPDALISDIAMPDEDGYAFMRRVREMESAQGRPRLLALALTAFARAEDRLRALQAGFDNHLAKPIDSRTVLRTLAAAIGRSAQGAALPVRPLG